MTSALYVPQPELDWHWWVVYPDDWSKNGALCVKFGPFVAKDLSRLARERTGRGKWGITTDRKVIESMPHACRECLELLHA